MHTTHTLIALISVFQTNCMSTGYRPTSLPQHTEQVQKAHPSNSCLSEAEAGSCTFYKCAESEYSCGSTGYLQGFGLKYCKQFLNLCPNKITQKKTVKTRRMESWMKGVRICLQKRLAKSLFPRDQIVDNKPMSCEDISSQAWKTDHLKCYLDRGVENTAPNFCDFTVKEIIILAKCVEFQDRFQRSSIDLFRRLIMHCKQSRSP